MDVSDVDRMSRIVLIGTEGRRREYFMRACEERGRTAVFLSVDTPSLSERLCEGDAVKMDPPVNRSAFIGDLNRHISAYEALLSDLGKREDLRFLNHPDAIRHTLNKRRCKTTLERAGFPTTPMLNFEGKSFSELLAFLQERRLSKVFVKPNVGSGAAGVVALAVHPKSGRIAAETSLLPAAREDGSPDYVNTKRLRHYTDREDVEPMVDALLRSDAVIERWVAKERAGGGVYDLRAVVQFSKLSFLQARGARESAITNLHLNNLALELDELGLSEREKEEIASLSIRAAGCFSGLQTAGLDLLLEKGSRHLKIIEVNGQGDLMYRDIFEENRIYREQAARMDAVLRGTGGELG